MLFRRGWLIAAGAMLTASPVWPQAVPVRTLSQPDATFPHGFTSVAGVRELTDGRVILVDVYDGVQVIDAGWAAMRQVGRRGAGPGEYREPYDIFALPGDSSAVPDRQTELLLVITPDAQPGGFLDARGYAGQKVAPCAECRHTAVGIRIRTASATDQRGYFYARAEPIVASSSGELKLADSAAIERWTAITPGRDTVGFLPYSMKPGTQIISGFHCCWPMSERIAFETSAQWAIDPDGRLAIVHLDPYRVDFVDASGNGMSGSPILYDRLRVTEAHKRQWREKQQQRSPMLVLTRDGQSGTVGATPDPVEPKWLKYLPPFQPRDAVHFASDGMLWVERTTPVDDPPTFDIIDRTGTVVEQVKLPQHRRLVGFGTGTVYLVRIDEVDLEYLERYPLGRRLR